MREQLLCSVAETLEPRKLLSGTSANQLVFVESPPATAVNGVLGTIRVEIENSSNQLLAGDDSNVTVSIAAMPGTSPAPTITLKGNATVAAINGVATFVGLAFSATATGASAPGTYVLTVMDGSDTSATANVQYTTNQLVFSPPAITAVGMALNSITVLVDSGMTQDMSDMSDVTLAIASGPTGATLGGGMTTIPADRGTATFTGLTVSAPGTYTLVATDGLDTAATSLPFTVYSPSYGFGIRALFSSANPAALAPQGGLTLAGGNLYGQESNSTTSTIFEISGETANINTLGTFNTMAGAGPNTGLTVDSAGDIFGTSPKGGAFGLGKVFEIAAGSSSVTNLASFSGIDGSDPNAGLAFDSKGDEFGTTAGGGVYGDGTIFEIKSGTIVTLFSFKGTDGAIPAGGLLEVGSELFGTTESGGSGNIGTLFEIPLSSATSLTTLASFNGDDGSSPESELVDSGGNLYGTTTTGGTAGQGTVFQFNTGNLSLSTLADLNEAISSAPGTGIVVDSGGDVFGASGETVFEISAITGAMSVIASFNDGQGQVAGGLAIDNNGNLFGTLSGGYSGNYQDGAVFELMNGSQLEITQPASAAMPPNSLGTITVNVDNLTSVPPPATDVTLTVAAVPGDVPVQTETAAVVGGMARFSNLSIANPGTYVLIASDNAGEFATSSPFTFGNQLAFVPMFSAEPNSVTVNIEDQNGNVLTGDKSTITLAISGPGAPMPQIAAAGNGVAVFNNLPIAAPGTYVLTATDSDDANGAVTHATESIIIPQTATTSGILVIQNPPTFEMAGRLQPVKLYVNDSAGDVLPYDESTVIAAGATAQGAVIGGTTTVSANAGLARFNDLTIGAGGVYTLTFTDPQDTSASVSTTFTDSVPFPVFRKVVVPATAVSGESWNAHLPLLIRNRAAGPATNVGVTLYADPNSDFNGNSPNMVRLTRLVVPQVNQSALVRLHVPSLPSEMAPGTYHLVAEIADPSGFLNIAAAQQTFQVVAPSIVRLGALSPNNILAGHIGILPVTITNLESKPAIVDITLLLSSNGITSLQNIVLNTGPNNLRILPGQGRIFRLRFRVPVTIAPGNYYPYLSISLDGVASTAMGMQFAISG